MNNKSFRLGDESNIHVFSNHAASVLLLLKKNRDTLSEVMKSIIRDIYSKLKDTYGVLITLYTKTMDSCTWTTLFLRTCVLLS